jgi:L-lactate transport
MWSQTYVFAGGSLAVSAAISAIPLLVLFYLLGVRRTAGWQAALAALVATIIVAIAIVGMPAGAALSAVVMGAGFGIFPISWIVFSSLLLYRIALETGQFEVIKASLASLTRDRRLQLLLVGFGFSAFIEGSAGFGSPVAVSAAMLTGLGFPAFYAALLCLVGNTAPVAFGSIGIPILTLAQTTGLPVDALSAMTGRLLAPVAVIVPAYLVFIMAGAGGAAAVWPAIAVTGLTFGVMQFFVSNAVGPELTDILAALATVGALVALMRVWRPRETFHLPGETAAATAEHRFSGLDVARAWLPYALLVVFVLAWGYAPFKAWLDQWTYRIPMPGLHNLIQRVPPVTTAPAPYAAIYTFNWLSAAGTACVLASLLAGFLLGVRPKRLAGMYLATLKQLAFPMLTIASVLAMAYLMNYAGMTSALGLAFAATGVSFPFFSAVLGWLGVVLTGSVTSSNALFGNLQVVTGQTLGLSTILTASTNAAGGVMGKMLSVQSLAVAVSATGMPAADESRLFRSLVGHSMLLVAVIGVLALMYAYVLPGLVPAS